MTPFHVEEELIDGTWTVVIHRGGELAGVGQGATLPDARSDALNDMTIGDFIELVLERRRKYWKGYVFGAVLIVMVMLLVAWQVLT